MAVFGLVRIARSCLLINIIIFISIDTAAQGTTTNTQFWNEFAFTHGLKKTKLALELNLGQTWTSTPEHKSMFATNSQLYIRAWLHYYHSARWKFSSFLAYYNNKDVPEINQKKAPELRTAFQAQYYFKKIPYTLNARFRLEDRKIQNDDKTLEATYRFRLQLRFVYPFNNKFIRRNTYYAIGSNEIMVKTYSYLVGGQFLDRNKFTIGGGYAVSDDLQLEITYVNEYMPRSGSDEMVNALQVNMVFNNLIPTIRKNIKKRKQLESISND